VSKGQHAESIACTYLESRGLRLVTRNFRCRSGEIDLIMEEGKTLVFVEVRLRAHRTFGTPAETIDRRKRTKLVACALHYLQRHHAMSTRPSRFDVVGLTPAEDSYRVDWIPDAIQLESGPWT
jgi:putative endonuclease